MLRWFAPGVVLLFACRPAPVTTLAPVTASPTRLAVVVDPRPLAPAWTAEVGALYASGDAAALLATGEPYHMARAGELLAAAGDLAGARGAWVRAHDGFVRRGADVQLHWLDQTSMQALHVDGDRRVEVTWSATPEVWGPFVGAIAFAAADGPATRRVLWPRIVRTLAVTADGQTLVHDDGGDVVVRDARSGLVIRRIDTADEELAHLVVAGTGDAIHVLSAGDREIALWDPSGRRIAEYTLAGTAPYLVRVYTGPGARHDNVIEHARTWPTALAIRSDAQMVAIGAANATILVGDVDGSTPRLLSAQFPASADVSDVQQNQPIALRFTPAGLVAVHAYGDVVVWDPPSGKQLRHLPGACTAAETWRSHGDDPRGRPAPDRETRAYCGVTRQAEIARAGDTVALASHAGHVRMRRIRDGATIGMWPGQCVPHGDIGITAAGDAVVTTYGGAVTNLHPGRPPRIIVAPQEDSAIEHMLGPGPLFSYKPLSGGLVAWDLRRGRKAPLPSEAVRIGDGYVVVRVNDRVEVQDVKTGALRFSAPLIPESRVTVTAAPTGQAVLTLHPPWQRPELTQRHFLVDPRAGTSRPLALRNSQFKDPILSPDGRWVVTDAGDLLLWDVVTGQSRRVSRPDARRTVFSEDGAHLGWAEWDRAALLTLARKGAGAQYLQFAEGEEVNDLAFTPDGRTLWVVTRKHLARWDTTSGLHESFEIPVGYVRESLHLDPSGKAIAVGGTFVELYTTAGKRVARLFHTPGGGWVALSAAGAVDGSDDAAGQLVTRVARGDEVLMFDGRLGWDSRRVAGLVLRALAGEDVPPPPR